MRTVVFISLLIIGGALRHQAGMKELESAEFLAIVLICAIVMDVVEFFVKITKK